MFQWFDVIPYGKLVFHLFIFGFVSLTDAVFPSLLEANEYGQLAINLVACAVLYYLSRTLKLDQPPSEIGLGFPLTTLIIFAVLCVFFNFAGNGFANPPDVFIVIALPFSVSLFEELIFRGLLLRYYRLWGKSLFRAVVYSSLYFSFIHIANGIPLDQKLYLLIFAVSIATVFAAITLENLSLKYAILFHWINNAIGKFVVVGSESDLLRAAFLVGPFIIALLILNRYIKALNLPPKNEKSPKIVIPR